MRLHVVTLASLISLIAGATTKHLLWEYSGPSLVAIKTHIQHTPSRIACVESLAKDEDGQREALFRTECITFEREALLWGNPLPKEYAARRLKEVSQRLVAFPLKSMERLKIGILGKSDPILKYLEKNSKKAEIRSVESQVRLSRMYDLGDFGMSSNCFFETRKGYNEQFALVEMLKSLIEQQISTTWALGFLDKIKTAQHEEMRKLSDRARLMETLNSKVLADFKDIPPCDDQLLNLFLEEIDQVINAKPNVFNPWFNAHCHLPPSPDVHLTRKEAAGKVLAYAKIRGEKIAEDIRILAKSMPNLQVIDPQTGALIAEIPAFGPDDVTDALRKIKPIQFSPDAEIDSIARDFLEGGAECKSLCVERFANWAVDELEKGTATKAFVLEVRKKLQNRLFDE